MQGGKVSTVMGRRRHFSPMPASPLVLLYDLPPLTLRVCWTYVRLKLHWLCVLQTTLL
uniref:Uncharacterized protein n=1 Tax=Arundo donax TaxID=35708 RepID=A0A0A9F5N8_ARUDO